MEPPTDNREVRRIYRMLREMARLAREASLTGSLERGARSSVHQYNNSLHRLEQTGMVPEGLFASLPEDTGFDEIGVAAAQLAVFLEDDAAAAPDTPPPGAGAPKLFGSHNVLNIGMGPRELNDLKELGQVIRENLPEWLAGRVPSRPSPPEPPAPPAPPEPPHAAGPNGLTDVESRLAEVGARLQAAAEQLRRGDLTDLQRADLAEQLSRLGQEQARLARQHAMLREAAV